MEEILGNKYVMGQILDFFYLSEVLSSVFTITKSVYSRRTEILEQMTTLTIQNSPKDLLKFRAWALSSPLPPFINVKKIIIDNQTVRAERRDFIDLWFNPLLSFKNVECLELRDSTKSWGTSQPSTSFRISWDYFLSVSRNLKEIILKGELSVQHTLLKDLTLVPKLQSLKIIDPHLKWDLREAHQTDLLPNYQLVSAELCFHSLLAGSEGNFWTWMQSGKSTLRHFSLALRLPFGIQFPEGVDFPCLQSINLTVYSLSEVALLKALTIGGTSKVVSLNCDEAGSDTLLGEALNVLAVSSQTLKKLELRHADHGALRKLIKVVSDCMELRELVVRSKVNDLKAGSQFVTDITRLIRRKETKLQRLNHFPFRLLSLGEDCPPQLKYRHLGVDSEDLTPMLQVFIDYFGETLANYVDGSFLRSRLYIQSILTEEHLDRFFFAEESSRLCCCLNIASPWLRLYLMGAKQVESLYLRSFHLGNLINSRKVKDSIQHLGILSKTLSLDYPCNRSTKDLDIVRTILKELQFAGLTLTSQEQIFSLSSWSSDWSTLEYLHVLRQASYPSLRLYLGSNLRELTLRDTSLDFLEWKKLLDSMKVSDNCSNLRSLSLNPARFKTDPEHFENIPKFYRDKTDFIFLFLDFCLSCCRNMTVICLEYSKQYSGDEVEDILQNNFSKVIEPLNVFYDTLTEYAIPYPQHTSMVDLVIELRQIIQESIESPLTFLFGIDLGDLTDEFNHGRAYTFSLPIYSDDEEPTESNRQGSTNIGELLTSELLRHSLNKRFDINLKWCQRITDLPRSYYYYINTWVQIFKSRSSLLFLDGEDLDAPLSCQSDTTIPLFSSKAKNYLSRIKTLVIRNMLMDQNSIFLHVIKILPNLSMLELDNIHFTGLQGQARQDLLSCIRSKSPSLRILKISSVDFTDEEHQCLSQISDLTVLKLG